MERKQIKVLLSDRMQMVADMVDDCKAVADIGCDHAFVSIYLIQSQKAVRVIAMDVVSGPLDMARNNITEYGLADRIELRQSNGFAALNEGECDTAVIAGMGGLLMTDILRAGKCHTDAGIGLVLQPQSEIWKVREYLFSIGYDIDDENMVFEDGKFYNVIKAKPAERGIREYDYIELRFGRILLDKGSAVLAEYLKALLRRNEGIMDKLCAEASNKSKDRCRELTEENKMLNLAMTRIENAG